MAREYRERGVDFIAVSTFRVADAREDTVERRQAVNEEVAKLTGMASFNAMTMPVGMAPPESQFLKDYHVVNASAIVIGPTGQVAYHGGMNLDRLRAELDRMLGGDSKR